ncbi:MAG: hypothetical protein ACI4RJ_05710, partial [Alphaproteobacteria bacterium]
KSVAEIVNKTLKLLMKSSLFGIVVGTYSSLFLAVPALRFFDLRRIGTTSEQTGPYAEAAKYEMEAKKEPLGAYKKCGRNCK